MLRSRRSVWLAALAVGGLALVLTGCPGPGGLPHDNIPSVPRTEFGPGNYLFCFWNVENLFDDQDDGRKTRGDHEPDSWFAHDKDALKAKLDHLCQVLLPLNDGKGPDILAVAELESERSAELLKEALNERLRRADKPEWTYEHVLFKPVGAGRHIATAVLTRLPVEGNRTQLLEKRHRILEGHVKVAGQPLVIIASHWTSRLGEGKGVEGRAKYGDQIYGRFKGMYLANPRIDLLVCGDFNDNPDDTSVTNHLHATGDLEAVRAGGEPRLFDLFAGLYAKGEMSLFYRKKCLFDQVCVSPGMLDQEGWSCNVASARVVKAMADQRGHPNRFGNEKDRRPLSRRGASDHFPVTVQLSVR
jgi:endonuclease/exonuclease/phosphatase family metal-dependent hydrolase